MYDTRLPKQVAHSKLSAALKSIGGQIMRIRDAMKEYMKEGLMYQDSREESAHTRSK